MNDKLIISKYKELVEKIKSLPVTNKAENAWIGKKWISVTLHLVEIEKVVEAIESELSLLQEQEKESSVNFMQIRELTDEEWMKLPKEEILQLYKNCYAMFQNYVKLSGEKIPQVQTVTSTDYKVDQSGIREELIKFACRNNKYQTTNIRNTEVPAFLEMLRKGHERSVDDYLKSNQ